MFESILSNAHDLTRAEREMHLRDELGITQSMSIPRCTHTTAPTALYLVVPVMSASPCESQGFYSRFARRKCPSHLPQRHDANFHIRLTLRFETCPITGIERYHREWPKVRDHPSRGRKDKLTYSHHEQETHHTGRTARYSAAGE